MGTNERVLDGRTATKTARATEVAVEKLPRGIILTAIKNKQSMIGWRYHIYRSLSKAEEMYFGTSITRMRDEP